MRNEKIKKKKTKNKKQNPDNILKINKELLLSTHNEKSEVRPKSVVQAVRGGPGGFLRVAWGPSHQPDTGLAQGC